MITSGRYTDQSGKDSVERERQRGLSVAHPGEEERGQTVGTGGHIGRREGVRDCHAVVFTEGGKLRTGIKSEPQDEHAEGGESEAMAGNR